MKEPQSADRYEVLDLDLVERKHQRYVDGCATCERIKTQHGGFGPDHDASERCESGKFSHCSCDTCF